MTQSASEQHKAIVRHYFAEVFSKGNFAVIDEVADAAIAEPMKRGVTALRTAFADVHDDVQEQVAEGDKVCTKFTGGGVHQGAFMGVAPTGKRVTWTGVAIDRFANGKIVERWALVDEAGVVEQLKSK